MSEDKAVLQYIKDVGATLDRLFNLMHDGSLKMSDKVWNEIEDKIESGHLNYHPLVKAWMEQHGG